MLIIISDLHLTDGTIGSTISPGAFRLLVERIQDLAVRASCRTNGSYRPIERIDLLLLGDALDLIRSSRWLDKSVRPWCNPHSPEMVQLVTSITDGIIVHNDASLSILRALADDGSIRISAANSLGRPVQSTEGHPVPVRIHYMVGNHDWFFHLRGSAYDALRQRVVDHLGLANRYDEPFPHEPRESDELLDVLRRHKVFARHGDIHDPFNFEDDRDASSLGDAIVIELINRFLAQVEAELVSELPPGTVVGLREIDNVRPLILIPVWIDGLLERTCAMPAMRKQLKMIWDGLADEFLDLAFVRARDNWSPVDIVDGLQRALKFSKRLSVGWASRTVEWTYRLRGAKESSYYQHALTEQDFRNRRAKHIVYGHTHHAETVPLDASFAEGYVLNQIYFNSGTWRRVHRQTQWSPGEHEFIASDTLTYLAFFQGDERRGRPYETWTGTLGTSASDVTIHRIDPGVAGHASGQSISASSLSSHNPHFSSSSGQPPIVPTRRV